MLWYPLDEGHEKGRQLEDEACPYNQDSQRDVSPQLVIYPVPEDKEANQSGHGEETEGADVAQKPPEFIMRNERKTF